MICEGFHDAFAIDGTNAMVTGNPGLNEPGCVITFVIGVPNAKNPTGKARSNFRPKKTDGPGAVCLKPQV